MSLVMSSFKVAARPLTPAQEDWLEAMDIHITNNRTSAHCIIIHGNI